MKLNQSRCVRGSIATGLLTSRGQIFREFERFSGIDRYSFVTPAVCIGCASLTIKTQRETGKGENDAKSLHRRG